MPDLNVRQRDVRFLRAARTVLKDYTFQAVAPGHTRVGGPNGAYDVVVSLDWSETPRCTCSDNARGSNGGYCKHVIAVMLREEPLRCQLLELFL